MRILVCGGRNFNDTSMLWNELDALGKIDCIIQGDATGADSLAKDYATEHGIDHEDYPAKWDNVKAPGAVIRTSKYGRKYNVLAGFQRNEKMIIFGEPDLVIAFPGDKGTADMVKRARKAGIEVKEISY